MRGVPLQDRSLQLGTRILKVSISPLAHFADGHVDAGPTSKYRLNAHLALPNYGGYPFPYPPAGFEHL